MAITISGDGTMQQMASGGITGGATLTAGTAVASTSGTSIDFTSIPSWVKRITVMFSGVSTNGTSIKQIQIGAGSIDTTGYLSVAQNVSSNTAATSGFILETASVAAQLYISQIVLTLVSGNTWITSGVQGQTTTATNMTMFGGTKTLSGTLDRLRITTVNGTDTFDAGTINILYE